MIANQFRKQECLSNRDRDAAIAQIMQRIGPTRPTMVWLFGSMARGEATVNSDIDLLLVYEDETSVRIAREQIYRDLKAPLTSLPSDLIFVTREEFERKSLMGGVCFIAKHEGVDLLKGRLT